MIYREHDKDCALNNIVPPIYEHGMPKRFVPGYIYCTCGLEEYREVYYEEEEKEEA